MEEDEEVKVQIVKPRHIRLRYQQFFFDDDPLYVRFKNKPFYILYPIYIYLYFRVHLNFNEGNSWCNSRNCILGLI